MNDRIAMASLGAGEIALCVRFLQNGSRRWFVFRPAFQAPLTKEKGVVVMSGKTDVVKGRIKEAAGALTGNEKLRAEGRTDQAVGEAKQAVTKAVGRVKKAVKKVLE